MSERLPYRAETTQSKDVQELNEFLSRELYRIESALIWIEESETVKHLESTANASTSSVLMLNCSATAIVITLPSASRVTGKTYITKKTDSGANKAAIRAVGSETIDGAASASLTAQYQVKRFISDGTNWYVI